MRSPSPRNSLVTETLQEEELHGSQRSRVGQKTVSVPAGGRAVADEARSQHTTSQDALADRLVVEVGVVTMAALAPLWGRRNARVVRDWCQRHGVPYRRDGKHNWVSLADVRGAISRLPLCGVAGGQRTGAAAAAVAALTGGR